MATVTMDEAKVHLVDLIEAAVKGEPFLIEGDHNRVLRITAEDLSAPVRSTPRKKEVIAGRLDRPPMVFGSLQGQAVLPEDFDRFMEDEIAEMFGMKE